jgi:hypothetical protein
MEITLRDVYDAQLHTAEQLAALTAQVSQLGARVDERLDSGQRRIDDHEGRLRGLEHSIPANAEARITALEKLAWKLIGAFAAVNATAVLLEWLIWSKK